MRGTGSPVLPASSASVGTTGSSDSNRAGTLRPAFQSLMRCAEAPPGRFPRAARIRFSAALATRRSVGFPAAAYSSV
ncbi:hypothetical protein C6575_29110, partial [Nocardia seriolae]